MVYPRVVQAWYYQGSSQRGAQYTFSALAIQTALTLRLLYHLPLRQTEGFVASIVAMMGLSLRVPDHTTLARRQADLGIALPKQRSGQPRHLVVDSTGLKVYGEGEWKVRQHGFSQRRTWRKLHVGVDEASGEIVAQTLTTNRQDDAGQVKPLLAQIKTPIEAVGGDGAYDRRKVFDALAAPEQGAPIRPIIPPRKNAKIQQHGNTQAEPLPCDETIRAIRKQGRRAWKKPADITDDPSSKRTSVATNKSSATPCTLEPYPTNRPKHGWAVPCSTGCYSWLNPNPIR